MPKSTVRATVHTECLGTEREGKPIMLSLDGNNSQDTHVFLDTFLTKEEAQALIQELQAVVDTLGEIK